MKSLSLLIISLLFISCSNMTIGFEEDSPFYNGPIIDTRKGIDSEKEAAINKEKVEKVVVQAVPKEQKIEEENIKVLKETAPKENETTFTYERDDE